MNLRYLIFLFAGFLFFFAACKKDSPIDENQKYGKISILFSHKINGQPLVIDTMIYTNAAGNEYLINEVQYFISDVILHKNDGKTIQLNQWDDIHYVDNDIPSTMRWDFPDKVPIGTYNAISFTFGINEAKNQSFMFLNPPERDMFWPEYLGGGYHYLKLNGKWKDTSSFITPFNFHLGIGQLYHSNIIVVDSIYAFVQNYFSVTLSGLDIEIRQDETRQIELVMNIESWFDTPHVWDFNYWGGEIMQNQQAMQTAKENGYDVFSIGNVR